MNREKNRVFWNVCLQPAVVQGKSMKFLVLAIFPPLDAVPAEILSSSWLQL
jgi:hypothetical protein